VMSRSWATGGDAGIRTIPLRSVPDPPVSHGAGPNKQASATKMHTVCGTVSSGPYAWVTTCDHQADAGDDA
jgi:hypothetical protein